MVLLPEERGMTLVELRQMAARQQHQIEAQQQLLVAKEQRLKFLKQQEARHHSLQEDTLSLLSLRDKVESQELKLRQLRALRGQVEQQKTNNGNLGTELESIRALFCEKEKELDLAVSKVEELTRQLDEIQKNSRKNCLITSSSELENLKRDLLYRTKLSEQQNNYICQQRDKIAYRQQDIANLDKKINELNKRLHRKRLLNEQFASQIHTVSLARASSGSILSTNTFLKTESQELAESEHAQDDLAATLHGHHSSDLGEFSLTKNDPKYQTLPYNTKFTLKDKQSEDSLSSSTEDESWYLHHEDSTSGTNTASHINIYNIPPHPFKSSATELHKIEVQETQNNVDKTSEDCSSSEVGESKNDSHPVEIRDLDDIPPKPKSQSILSRPNSKSMNKPAVPPKPALSVKPMLTNSMTSFKRKTEPDTVNMALTFLKNKSTEKEKSDISNYRERLLYYQCIPRFSTVRDSTQDPLLPKSRILTYFSKTLLQPEDSTHDPKIAPNITPKRKSGFGQLPIKPKPLTIRKTPGIEPPKLKIQPVAPLNSHRKTLESQPIPLTVKVSKNLATSENDEKSIFLPNSSDNGFLKVTSKTEVGKNDHSQSESSDTLDKNESDSEIIEKQDMDDGSATDEQVEATDQSDSSIEPLGVVQKLKKGNLKCEGTIRGSRRVSFDPLALLLDAALEGELELVKKTANEVVNASAANDEGITALHNAICAGHFDVVRFLVQFGCDVNAQDSDGWTPLHCAASCNNLAMVKFLVERGACIFATTLSDQETAAEKCEEDEEGFDGCSEYLFSLQENLGIINNCVVYAVYDYDGQNADELSFRNGDKLTVLRKSDNEENEWWWSRLHDEEGYIPRNLLGLYPRVAKECPADG